MKKLLSVILAVSLIMSLFCMVPASAESINTWPYYYEDFEDNASSLTNLTVVENGVNGSGYAAQYTDTKNTENDDFSFDSSFKGWICNGDTIKFTAKLKLAQEIDEDEARLLFHITGGSNTLYNEEAYPDGNAWFTVGGKYLNFSFDRTSTDWQTMSYTGVYTGVDVYVGETKATSFRLRVAENESFLIDDIELVIGKVDEKKYGTSPINSETNIITSGGTESWGDIKVTAKDYTKATEDVTSVVTGTEEDPAPEGEKYLRIVHPNDSTSPPYITIPLSENMKYGHTYKLTYTIRATFDENWTGGYSYVTNRIRYPHNSGVYKGIDARWAGDKTYTHTGYDDWQTFDYYFIYDSATYIEDVTTLPHVQVGLWCYYSNGRIGATYDIDNIQFIDMGAITNGGFDSVVDDSNSMSFNVLESYAEGKALTESDISSAQTLGWLFDGTVAATNGGGDVRYKLTSTTKHSRDSKNINAIIYGKQSEAGNMYQYVPMEYSQKATLSCWIRPTKTGSVTNVDEHKIRLVLDYSGETSENEVYDVLTGTDNGKIYGDWVTVAATSGDNYTWYNPKITVDNIFPLIEGKTETEGIIPKSPKLYLEFDYEGVVNTSNHAAYLDEFAISYEGHAYSPAITASATTAAGGVVTVTKDTTAPTDVTVTSVVKLTATKDGVKSYIGSTTGTAITVPEAYQTGYTLAAEITPIGSNGYIGKTVTIEVPAVPVVVGTTFTATEADGATLTSGETMEGLAIWVAYDTYGEMLDWSSAPMSVTAGGTQTVAIPADFDATGAAEVKVMLWADMVECKPLADHVTY